MKVLILLLIGLTLYLSATPCCTEDFANSAEDHSCEETSDCENIPCDEPCSPFYTCGSCTGFLVLELEAYFLLQEEVPCAVINSKFNFYRENYHSTSFKPPRARLKSA